MSGRTYLSIGDVLTLLREEFPDVTISKIRFLESQGLVNPERSPSGYRKFFETDVERLRWVLRQQREHFLPLKVIRDRLADGDLSEGGAEVQADDAVTHVNGRRARAGARRCARHVGAIGDVRAVGAVGAVGRIWWLGTSGRTRAGPGRVAERRRDARASNAGAGSDQSRRRGHGADLATRPAVPLGSPTRSLHPPLARGARSGRPGAAGTQCYPRIRRSRRVGTRTGAARSCCAHTAPAGNRARASTRSLTRRRGRPG